MSNHRGPENVPPDELRCEALVKGTRSAAYWRWMRHDRRCAHRMNQGRDGIAVCHVHAKIEHLVKWQQKGNET